MSADINPKKKPSANERKIEAKPVAEIIDTPVSSSEPAETQSQKYNYQILEVEKKALRIIF